eukprot:5210386-Alexandrium_andersonii.AAC.1
MHVGGVGCAAAARSHRGVPGGKALVQEGDGGRLSARRNNSSSKVKVRGQLLAGGRAGRRLGAARPLL